MGDSVASYAKGKWDNRKVLRSKIEYCLQCSLTCQTKCAAKLYFAVYLKSSVTHTAMCSVIKFSFIGELCAACVSLPISLFTPSDDFGLSRISLHHDISHPCLKNKQTKKS